MGAPAIPEVSLGAFLDELDVAGRRIPIQGTLETTYRCNLACAHCYVNQPAASREERERELTTARLRTLVDELAEAGCLSLLLTGGEVLLRPDFPELYRHALARGLRVTVFTNGTLVTERVAALLGEHRPALVEISLYGATRETYERVTQVPGSFERCLDGIERLRRHQVPLALKTMLLAWNAHELQAMEQLAARLGLRFRYDGLLNARVDCGANRNPELQLAPERLAAIELDDPARRAAIAAALAPLGREGVEVAPAPGVYSCGAGQVTFTVNPYGDLQLCELSRRSGYNLREQRFERGWNAHLPALRERRWQHNAVCRACTLADVCGNCPGAAELEHGDPEAIVAHFCELTHLRAFGVAEAVPGHRRDAACCLGAQARSAGAERASAAAGCGGCRNAAPPAPLLQLGRARRAADSGR